MATNRNTDRREINSTKQLIISKAIHLFAKKGVAEVTFQEIADACKLTQPAAFYYFKNKEHLVFATIEDLASRNYSTVERQINIEDDAYVMLLKHFLGNLVWSFKHRDDACLLVHLYHLACSQKKYAAIYAELLERARSRMLERVMAGVRENIFSFSDPKEEIAERLHESMLGVYVNLMTKSLEMNAKQRNLALEVSLLKWNATIRDVLHYRGAVKDVKILLREFSKSNP